MRRAHWQRASRARRRVLLDWDATQIRMMRASTVWATFLGFGAAASPVVTLGEAAVTHFMFIDDRPLVLGIGTLQHGTVGGRMIVGAAIFGAPCTPTIMLFGRIVIASLGVWRIVVRCRRSSIECRSIRRASPLSANYITILLVSSRDALLASFCLRVLSSRTRR